MPGAGQYKSGENISGFGKYNNSKHLGGTIAKFGRSSRATFVDEVVKNDKSKPGPGFYKSPSEFGQYDGDVYSMNATALSRFSKKWSTIFINNHICNNRILNAFRHDLQIENRQYTNYWHEKVRNKMYRPIAMLPYFLHQRPT